MKLGRNELCYCGSGKKYKRCCLDRDREQSRRRAPSAILFDRTSMRMRELYLQEHADFDRRYTVPVDELEARLLAHIGDGLEDEEAATALKEHMRSCESAMQEILRSHSRLFWVHLSRRVPPVPLYGANEWTTRLYRLVFELVVLKHGRPYHECDDMAVDDLGTLFPRELHHDDHVAIYQVEQLAHSFNHAAASYRRAAKGGVLRVETDSTFSVEADAELEELIQSIDARVARYSEILSPFGSTADVSFRDGSSYDGLVLAGLNVFQKPWPEELLRGSNLGPDPFGGKPNYLPDLIHLGELETVMHAFEEQIQALTGLTSQELVGFLWALTWHHVAAMRSSAYATAQFFQRGYLLTTDGDPFERTSGELAQLYSLRLREARGEAVEEQVAVDVVRRAFKALAYTDDELAVIDLWSRTPRKVILREGRYTLWDYSAIGHYFHSLFEQIGLLTGPVGNVKGEGFENELLAAIELHDDLEVWQARRGLKAEDGSSREVDVSFVAGETLYLVECKAFSAHPYLDRGDEAVLARRWEKLLESLEQADSLRAFLLAHRSGTNYAVPERVNEIRACVCTPMPEYIPTRDARVWFDEETPRICVPAELLEFVAQVEGRGTRSTLGP